jgi:hypothetical protein
VVEPLSFLLGQLEHLAGPLGKFVESVSHRISPSGDLYRWEPITPGAQV